MLRHEGRGDFCQETACPDCVARAKDGSHNTGTPIFCCRDCFLNDLVCSSCCMQCHHWEPLHCIKVSESNDCHDCIKEELFSIGTGSASNKRAWRILVCMSNWTTWAWDANFLYLVIRNSRFCMAMASIMLRSITVGAKGSCLSIYSFSDEAGFLRANASPEQPPAFNCWNFFIFFPSVPRHPCTTSIIHWRSLWQTQESTSLRLAWRHLCRCFCSGDTWKCLREGEGGIQRMASRPQSATILPFSACPVCALVLTYLKAGRMPL